MSVPYILTPNGISIVLDGKAETVTKGGTKYDRLLEALHNGDSVESIRAIVNPANIVEEVDGMELTEGVLRYNGKKVPEVLTKRILAFRDQNLPFKPLMKFAEKLMQNPSYNSREQLYRFLEHNNQPITSNGNFIAYKKVREDFKDCHTGTIDNSVGKVVEMDRNEVDDNPNNTCSSGLHVAAYNYASNFSSGHLMFVEVNPMDVVSVPVDYNNEKMRVCKYEVKEVCESKLEQELYEEEKEEIVSYDINGDLIEVGDMVRDLRDGDEGEVLEIYEDGYVKVLDNACWEGDTNVYLGNKVELI